MTKMRLGLTALVVLTACGSTTANIKATPLKAQSAAQVEADRKQCNEWAKTTAAVRTGYAACLVASGYETRPEVRSSSETVRLAGAPSATEPTRVLLDILQCDSQARREAESNLGMISRLIRDHVNSYKPNAGKRRQVFVDCLKPLGDQIGMS